MTLSSWPEVAGGEVRLLACRVFAPELTALGVDPGRVRYLDQGLHRYPDDLRREAGAALRELEADPAVGRVILCYGYCGGGLEGLAARRAELLVPLAHDCIPLLRGRPPRVPAGEGESFFLSPGWIEHGQTPLTEHRITAERFGEEEALWVGRQLLRNYRRVVLLDTLAGLTEGHRAYAREMAGLFGLGLLEEKADPSRLARLVGDAPGGLPGECLVLPPGMPVSAGMFPRAGAEGGAG